MELKELLNNFLSLKSKEALSLIKETEGTEYEYMLENYSLLKLGEMSSFKAVRNASSRPNMENEDRDKEVVKQQAWHSRIAYQDPDLTLTDIIKKDIMVNKEDSKDFESMSDEEIERFLTKLEYYTTIGL